MTSREFFFLVSNMRRAQREYFATRDPMKLRYCRALEGEVDKEILRVKDLINEKIQAQQSTEPGTYNAL